MENTSKDFSEKEIVSLLLQRDIRGMDALYNQYSNYVFGLILKIIKHDDLAEIVLQDTFLKVWVKIDSFSIEKSRFVTWLLNIARNTAIDMTRSKNYKQTLKLTSLDKLANNKATDLGIKVENIDIKDIVAGLDQKYAEIIQLIYFEGYTQAEVAKVLGLPLGTVKSRVRKAFKDLKIILGND